MQLYLWCDSDAIDLEVGIRDQSRGDGVQIDLVELHDEVIDNPMVVTFDDIHTENVAACLRDCRGGTRERAGPIIENDSD